MNLPSINLDALPRIEAGLQFAKANRITWVRLNIGMAEATKGTTLDTYAATRAGQLCAQYGRKVVLVDYTQAPNTKYWRNQSGLDDAALWNSWKEDEANGNFQDCHNPNGLYPWLLPLAVETSNKLGEAFEAGYGRKVDIRQIENEPGNTLDAHLSPVLPYGSVSESVSVLIEAGSHKSGNLCAPAWETQNMAGLLQQVRAEDKSFWNRFAYQAINWYENWEPLDTPVSWATRAVAKLRAFIYDVWWPGRSVLVSELGAIGCPKELRLSCFKEFNRLKFSRVHAVLWFDFDSPVWGVQ